MQKKRFYIFLLVAVISIIINGCKNSEMNNQNKNDQVEKNEVQGEEYINAFENLSIKFNGWNGKGTIELITESCSDIVKDNIEFEYDISVNGTLKNDDIITVYANITNNNITLERTSCDYTVFGLPILNSVERFQNDVAWFKYTDCLNNISYIACMDSKGKTLFQYENELSDYTNFVNDRAMIVFEDKTTVGFIDKKGEILKTKSLNKIVYLCDDYCVDMEHIENFDNNYYLYTIYDVNGNIVYMDKTNETYDFLYLGNDVMVLDPKGNGFSGQKFGNFYFIENNKIIENATITSGEDFSLDNLFREGIIVTSIEENDIYFVDKLGNFIKKELEIDINFSGRWTYGKYNDGVVVLHQSIEDNYRLAYYDYETGKFIEGTEKIGEYINKINFETSPLYFSNGIILFQMTGDDGEVYTMAFDKEWNVVLEPTKTDIISQYFENCFEVGTAGEFKYYTYEGELIFSTENALTFKEGIAYLETFQWIGENGKILFNDIDINETPTIELGIVQKEEEKYEICGTYFGNFDTNIQIKEDGTIEYIEEGKKYTSTYQKEDEVWKTTIPFENAPTTVTIIQDESGNIFVDGDESMWIDEYFRRED